MARDNQWHFQGHHMSMQEGFAVGPEFNATVGLDHKADYESFLGAVRDDPDNATG